MDTERLRKIWILCGVVLVGILLLLGPWSRSDHRLEVAVLLNSGEEYYGKMNQKVFEKIVDEEFKQSFVELSSASGFNTEGKLVKISSLAENGQPLGYTDTIYLRIDTIDRLTPLTRDFIERHLSKP